ALVRVLTVVVLECAFDIHRMGIMSLNQVRVVAVHGSNEFSEGVEQSFRQASTKTGGLLGKIEGNVRQKTAMAGNLTNEQWLHRGDPFAPVDRFCVRFNGHMLYLIISFTIMYLR